MLLDCVTSILQNDFQDFEIIIVDQDRPRTLQTHLARRFNNDARLVYVVLDEASLSRARNLGIHHARGHILVFSDDDTEVGPRWLRAYIEAFDALGKEPAVISGRLDPIWLAPKPGWLPPRREYLLGIYNPHDGPIPIPMPGTDLPVGANFAVHRKVMEAVGPFDERLGYSYARKRGMIGGEDSLFSLLARQARFPLYYQAGARVWHKMSAYKLNRVHFVRRSFWEGVTQLTVMHLSGSIPADRWRGVARWHARELLRWGGRLVRTLVQWRRVTNPAQEAMEAVCSIAQSAGMVRAALKLGTTGRLPW
jgi:GT2 family glycosyltransferase